MLNICTGVQGEYLVKECCYVQKFPNLWNKLYKRLSLSKETIANDKI